jgi:hypothetical protein
MKLASPFIQLPLKFDAERLAAEVAALPPEAWAKHPTGFQGNGAVRLISTDGGENDDMGGAMLPTPHLRQSPYIQQVLATFNTVFGRSRLMALGPHAEVPAHSDVNHHWFYRVRIHVPIVTFPEVSFHCDDQAVHMGAGEAWIFDNWRRHKVVNPTNNTRIHLVADTTGSADFWSLVAKGINPATSQALMPQAVPFDPDATPQIVTERFNMAHVMPPAELAFLAEDLLNDLQTAVNNYLSDANAAYNYIAIVKRFCANWRDTWSIYGDEKVHWPRYQALRQNFANDIIGRKLILASNRSLITPAMMGRVVLPCLDLPLDAVALMDDPHSGRPMLAPSRQATHHLPTPKFDRPLIILTAPRSGSTLLFETLQQSQVLMSLGGESHGIIEALPALNPMSGLVDSNRLTASHANAETINTIHQQFSNHLRDVNGQRPALDMPVRLLEKTPKNALRLPFLAKLFPDARYVFLYRDPREAISSIIECWQNGGWVTYPKLPDWNGAWSFLLPPQWQQLRDKPLAEVAAFQWQEANRFIVNDLAAIDRSNWMAMNYADFLHDPKTWIERIAMFADIPFDRGLIKRTATVLPHSRLTLTAPKADKWRQNEAAMLPYLTAAMSQFDAIKAFVQHHQDNAPAVVMVGRNDLCPCGSGNRYKHCHGKLI